MITDQDVRTFADYVILPLLLAGVVIFIVLRK